MTATYTDQGAIKVSPTPTGPTNAEGAISVVVAGDQTNTTPDMEKIELLREMRNYIRAIHDQLLKARL
jgi:flagellar basal body rod protein FlgF